MSEYSDSEETLNIYSHVFGAFLSFVGLLFLVYKTGQYHSFKIKMSLIVYGVSTLVLYIASSLYHSSKDPKMRLKRKILDHCAIYFSIAGSYTPFVLIAIGGRLGWTIFMMIWVIAIVGVILKLFFTGRFKLLSTLMYVLMGWLMVFFVEPLMEALPEQGFNWLIGGGLFFTIGAVIYSIKKIPFNHGIFHLFVLCGSISHFIAIYFYI